MPTFESELLSSYPNPAGERTRIPFVVARPGPMERSPCEPAGFGTVLQE